MPDLTLEAAAGRAEFRRIAGIDEAGRGPWAGPVMAGAVILTGALPEALAAGLDDSKKLTPRRRGDLFRALGEAEAEGLLAIGVGRAEVAEIDALNILGASLLAMARAVAQLAPAPDYALVDGNRAPDLPCPVETVIKGDSRSLIIAAASIVAKVTRDREMAALARIHPGYGWERNQGYGTAEHRDALARLGVTRAHRKSFKPIHKILSQA